MNEHTDNQILKFPNNNLQEEKNITPEKELPIFVSEEQLSLFDDEETDA